MSLLVKNVGGGQEAAPDGKKWTAGQKLPSRSGHGGVLAYGNGTFVYLPRCVNSEDNTVAYYSLDGIAWVQTTLPDVSVPVWTAVTYCDGVFLAISGRDSSNKCIYSTDGITWTAGSNLSSSAMWRGIASGKGLFVCVEWTGYGKVVRRNTSTPNATWSSASMPKTTDSDTDYSWSKIFYENGIFVAIGDHGEIAYSSNGSSFTVAARSATNLPNTSGWNLFAGGGYFIAYNGTRVYYSKDGMTFTACNKPGSISSSNVMVYGNGKLLVPNEKSMFSSNGADWTYGNDSNLSVTDACFGNGIFVACGFDGQMYYSRTTLDY